MAISDAERREVAAKLSVEAQAWRDTFPDEVCDLGDVSALMQDLCHFAGLRGKVPCGDIFQRFADLIDRPTCKLVEAWDGEREQHCLDCTACHFGRRAIEQEDAGVWYNARELWVNVEYDDLTHCPYCGAEVVR